MTPGRTHERFTADPAELLNRLTAKGKTLAREEKIFISEGWEAADPGCNLMQVFGGNVRFHRARQKLSQAQLALLTRLRMGTIPEIERAIHPPGLDG